MKEKTKQEKYLITILNLLFLFSTIYVIITNLDKPFLFQGFIIGIFDGFIIIIYTAEFIVYFKKKLIKKRSEKNND